MKKENIFILENSVTKKEKREYKIYNYFKKNAALLISIVSAMVVVITFILNSVLYASTCAYLTSWGFNSDSINIDMTGKPLILAAESIGLFSICFMLKILTVTYQKYLDDIDVILKTSELSREIKKRLNNKNIVKDDENKQIMVMLSNKDGTFTEGESVIKCLKEISKRVKKQPQKKLKQTLLIVSFFMILVWVYMLMMIIPNTHIIFVILFGGFATCVFIFVQYIKGYCVMKHKRKKKIKGEIKNIQFPIVVYFSENQEQELEYPLEKVANLKVREFFHDKGVASFVYTILVGIAVLFIWLYALSITTHKSSYPIISIDETTYVVIFENGNYYYLEQAQVNGKSLRVQTSFQRVIKKGDIQYEVKTFDKVEKIRE